MKIYSKILATTFPLVIFPLIIATGMSYFFSYQALTGLGRAWLEGRLAEVVKVAEDHEDMIRSLGIGDSDIAVKQVRMDAIAAMQSVSIGKQGYMFAVNADGKVVAHPDVSLIGNDLKREEWFRKVISGKILPGSLRGRPRGPEYRNLPLFSISICLPIFSGCLTEESLSIPQKVWPI